MKRDAVLDAAKELINGDRAKDYGDAYQNHARIADGWNVILKGALQTHGDLTPAHVVLMMDWVKTSRLLQTIDHDDSWVDKAGYTALGAEIAERDSRPVEQIIEDANGPTTNGDVPAKK
jgi:hypothetical protein|tara:strand:- start:4090 stop:4446 length:357 start_codon:yes stop_codon:yes gene_type:complete